MTDFNHKQASEQIARIYGVDAEINDGKLKSTFKYHVHTYDEDTHFIPFGDENKHSFHAACVCKPILSTSDCVNGFEFMHNLLTCSNVHITQNLGALMELAIRNGISVFVNDISQDATCSYWDKSYEYIHSVIEPYNNDPIEATRVAIAKALIRKNSVASQNTFDIKKGGEV